MQTLTTATAFDDPDLATILRDIDASHCDDLEFGVIGFDAETIVRVYNAHESRLASLASQRVIGQPLFTSVAPCMNNFLVAQRFEDAAASGSMLDATIDYVLTLRMRPVKVKLRLVAVPGAATRYVLVERAVR